MGSVGMWLALAAVIGVCIVVALGCMWLAYRILPESAGTEYNSSLSPFLTIIGLMFGALLGFTVVVAFEQFSSAGANVADEATTLTTMYRQTVTMPDPERTQIRQLLRVYTTAVKGPEWQSQKRSQANDTARSAITQMYRVIGNQQPSRREQSCHVQLRRATDRLIIRPQHAHPGRITSDTAGALVWPTHRGRNSRHDHGLYAPWK